MVNTPAAAPEPGDPKARRQGWHSRGYLPHRDDIERVQSITFRLADSVPRGALSRFEEQFALCPPAERDAERRKQMERWLDAGMGCCALRQPQLAETMENALLHFAGTRHRLLAWCVMPNHVHVVIKPERPLAGIVQSWKSFTARWARTKIPELELSIPREGAFWMREYWDRYIRDETHLRNVMEYVHANPVKAGLAPTAEEWPRSSARYLNGYPQR
jgi:type I restriction enzyme R subunit/putative DNA methylase